MQILFTESAWDDCLYWQKNDKKILKRINLLLKEIKRNPFQGVGKPESLKFQLKDFWSRRITKEHRLVYRIQEDKLQVIACRYHYS